MTIDVSGAEPTEPTTQDRILYHLALDDQYAPPSPDQLVVWLETSQRLGPGTDRDRQIAMARIVRAAERGGEAHMLAVAEWVGKLPPPPPDPTTPRYEFKDGQYRPSLHDTNVLIELRVHVDGRMFTAREAIDPYMLEHYGFYQGGDRLEEYLRHFIQMNFGLLAVADDEAYRYFRERVWVVRPTDRHDSKRCFDSNADTEGMLWPRCVSGNILRSWPDSSPIPGAGTAVRKDSILGSCPCRCHRRPQVPSEVAALLSGVGQFDEDQLDEKGNPR